LLEFVAGTHVGNLRDNNEDSYVCDPEKELWIVADGMGGLGFGEVASAISTHTIATHVKEGRGINQAIELAHKRIREFSDTEGLGANMGTTIVILLSQGSLYNIFWVGDSRAYLFHQQKITQLTTDHSLVQSLIEQGEITKEEAESDPRKNAVTRALGVQELETVKADSISDQWLPGQKILLCSDGLTDCVSTDSIGKILAQDGTDQSRVDKLIEAALAGGGKDNITIIIVSASVSAKQTQSHTHVPNEVTGAIIKPQVHQPKPERWFNVQNWLGAFAMVLTVIVFARFTTAERTEPESFASVQLVPMETIDVVPIARQGMPNIALPETGTVLQLGLFSKLEAAETRQQEASLKGYVPFIEKKINQDGVQFAVLLGPYYDEHSAESVSKALDQEGLNHFIRPDTHY